MVYEMDNGAMSIHMDRGASSAESVDAGDS